MTVADPGPAREVNAARLVDAGRLLEWTAFRVGRLKHWRAELEHNGRALALVVGHGPGGWRYGVEVYEGGALLTTTRADLATTDRTAARAKAFAAGLVAGWLNPLPL